MLTFNPNKTDIIIVNSRERGVKFVSMAPRELSKIDTFCPRVRVEESTIFATNDKLGSQIASKSVDKNTVKKSKKYQLFLITRPTAYAATNKFLFIPLPALLAKYFISLLTQIIKKSAQEASPQSTSFYRKGTDYAP